MKYFILSLLISSYLLKTECVYKLVWSDEFNGNNLDTSAWNYDTGDQWYNNELQGYTPSNVYVENGNLRIEARRENYLSKSYTAGRINSMHKKFWTYGRFEARMKFPIGTGFWPAFWLWPESWIASSYREIDIMEAVGNEPKNIYSTCWFGTDINAKSLSKGYSLPQNYDLDYHVYGADWKPGQIDFLVDGFVFYSCKSSLASSWDFDNLSTAKFHIILNLAVGGNWPGSPISSTVFPSSMYVDYVRVYQDDGNAETVTPTETTVPTQTVNTTQNLKCPVACPVAQVASVLLSVDEENYTSTSLKNGIHYLKSVGKVRTNLIAKVKVSSKKECFSKCKMTENCIALKYSLKKCLIFERASAE